MKAWYSTFVNHIKALKRTLNHSTSTLCRLRCSFPEFLHQQLYYTLFESHLSYCISVWGGAAKQRISSLFTAQKYCLRVLFGDRLAYLDKFKTCARTRPIGQQKLDQKLFIKEHTKPIFKHNNILAIQNLYTYHCSEKQIFRETNLNLDLYYRLYIQGGPKVSLHPGSSCS